MNVTRLIDGYVVELILEKVKEYTRFSLYQISKMIDGVKVPLYQESFTDLDIDKIINNGCRMKNWYEYQK